MRKKAITSAKGVVKWQQWRKAHEVIAQHPKRAWMALVLVVLVFSGGIFAWVVSRPEEVPQTRKLALDNGYDRTIKELVNKPLPADPLEQAYHYSQIAHSYEALEEYKDALHYYLEGQRVIDVRNLHEQASFYVAISDMYGRLGDTDQAAQYRKKAEDEVKANSGKNVPEDVIEATLGEKQ